METNQNDLEETDKILNASSASSRDIDDISRDTDKASIELYANIVNLSDNKILFEGKCISEWCNLLKLPPIPSVIENSDIIKLNQRGTQLLDIVYTNLSLAKARNTFAQAAFNKKFNSFKETLRDTKSADGKKLSISDLESLAKNRATAEQTALTITTVFYDFWEDRAKEVKEFNNRLTGLNITVNQESRFLNNAQNYVN